MEAATEEAADEEIARRQLRSPIDGVVDRVLAQVGEWVQPGQPIVEIVRLNRLRVETSLNAYEVSPREVAVGQPVEIEIQIGPRQVEKFTGKVGFVSNVVVADRYRVWVEFDNRKVGDFWAVSPGLQAVMTIQLRDLGGPISPVSAPKAARGN
jgi:multidrug efflux pump subunit AcrA (membrane-fusion protein)